MVFITSDIKKLYGKYLIVSLASAVVMSIYSFVDSIAVGQSVGSIGAASMAVITPLYGVLIFLAILCGVGGSVLYGNARGEGNTEKANALFTRLYCFNGWLNSFCMGSFCFVSRTYFYLFWSRCRTYANGYGICQMVDLVFTSFYFANIY